MKFGDEIVPAVGIYWPEVCFLFFRSMGGSHFQTSEPLYGVLVGKDRIVNFPFFTLESQ